MGGGGKEEGELVVGKGCTLRQSCGKATLKANCQLLKRGVEIQQFGLEGGSYSQGLGEILQRCAELEKLPTRHCSHTGETNLAVPF